MLSENPSNTSRLYRVAIPRPLRKSFTYRYAPPGAQEPLNPGTRVRVPFGNREVTGVILGEYFEAAIADEGLKEILCPLDAEPYVTGHLMSLLQWAANYYHHPVGEVIDCALPPGWETPEPPDSVDVCYSIGTDRQPPNWGRRVRQRALYVWLKDNPDATEAQIVAAGFAKRLLDALLDQQLVSAAEVIPTTPDRTSVLHPTSPEPLLIEAPPQLSDDQLNALQNLELGSYCTHLLEGITGSGKTEIYLQAAAQVLATGRQVLYLIPEIGLSPQTEQRIRSRFNCRVGVYHSGLSAKMRREIWRQARQGHLDFVLGTRSALFSPLQDLGLIIVDEEHDTSFKQQEGFRYSARDLAVIRAHNESIPLILGSATPSLESLKNAQDGNYRYLKLPQRVGKRAFPGWDIVDKLTNPPLCGFTQPLLERLQSTLDAGQQALVFLNRRGYATAIHCRDCGWTAGCPGCDRPITLHHRPNRLLCHHCGHVQRPNRCCPQCQSPNLEALGQGTERAEQFLQERFSGVPVLRIDRDSLSGKRSMKELIEIVNRNQPCILLGTQMLAKGHHFPAVALVAILDADNGLFSADFRGIERAAQLITQVSGRAGRGDYPGLAILQTEHRDHPMLQKMVTESYADFCEGLLNERKQRSLPPYTAMAILRANSARPQEAESFLAELASVISGSGESIQILGPMPSLIEKRRGRYRYQVQLISTKRSDLHRALETVVESAERLKISRYLRWSIDIDPQIID